MMAKGLIIKCILRMNSKQINIEDSYFNLLSAGGYLFYK